MRKSVGRRGPVPPRVGSSWTSQGDQSCQGHLEKRWEDVPDVAILEVHYFLGVPTWWLGKSDRVTSRSAHFSSGPSEESFVYQEITFMAIVWG